MRKMAQKRLAELDALRSTSLNTSGTASRAASRRPSGCGASAPSLSQPVAWPVTEEREAESKGHGGMHAPPMRGHTLLHLVRRHARILNGALRDIAPQAE